MLASTGNLNISGLPELTAASTLVISGNSALTSVTASKFTTTNHGYIDSSPLLPNCLCTKIGMQLTTVPVDWSCSANDTMATCN